MINYWIIKIKLYLFNSFINSSKNFFMSILVNISHMLHKINFNYQLNLKNQDLFLWWFVQSGQSTLNIYIKNSSKTIIYIIKIILITEPILNFYPGHFSAYIFHAFYSKDVYKYYIFFYLSLKMNFFSLISILNKIIKTKFQLICIYVLIYLNSLSVVVDNEIHR